MSTSRPTSEAVLQALRGVQDPDLRKDLVTLGMIKDLEIGADGAVSLRVVLTTPACPLKAKIEADVKAAVLSVAGVREARVKMDAEVRRAQGGASQSAPIAGVSHIIAVSSGKGGVGKSTVAVNLATALALEGARVGLMDADIYGPNVPTMMGVTERPTMQEHPEKGEVLVPPSSHGVKIMSMGFLVEGDQPVVWRGPMLHSVVNQFCHKVEWGGLDYLIVDMPPGTGDVQLSLAQLVPVSGVVMVTTPQEVSLQDVRKAFHMFAKVRVPVMGIVENMSYFRCDGCDKRHHPFGSDGGKALARKFDVELLAQLPMVPQVREGGDEGRPVVVRDPGSEVAQAFRALARSVAQKASIMGVATDPSQLIQIGRFN
ncbi:MAG: Mrp/NBP35 family ATP-binding protein [Oligoflexia bacterium]|nr:Mrp/NBP35 family ATP-binding protein [Oligoflexia bacterium]